MSIPIKNIFMTEMNFVRSQNVPDKINYTYTINVGANVDKETNISNVVVKLEILEKEQNSLKIVCCMVGVFDLTNTKELTVSVNDFLYINAPTIIFPYLRETVSSMTLRAGIKPLIIPTFNFKEMREKNQQKELRASERAKPKK